MHTLKFFSLLLGSALALPNVLDKRDANPITVASTQFLGYRNASNDQTVRDLGYMGNVGSTYILTFGDGLGTTNATTRANLPCAFTARNGGGIPSSDPLVYADINATDIGYCNHVPQMGRFCPLLPGQDDRSGYGLTNIVSINSTTGVLYVLPQNCPENQNCTSLGAGLAVVDTSSGKPVCKRPFGISTWSQNEPSWGQLGALMANDGYIYVYANGVDVTDSIKNNTVVLARVLPSQAFNKASYQYWHGSSTGFTSTPIYLSNLNANSPENLNFFAGQGSVFYSTFYKVYVYLNPYFGIWSQTAANPWGPWSSGTPIYSPNPVHEYIYAPVYQPKYTSADGSQIIIGWSDKAYEGLVRVTFK